MSNSSKNDKHNNLIIGFILIGISLLLMLILFGVFDPAGKYVKNFLLGSFGLSFYGITIACFIIGILKLFNFKFAITIGRLFEILGIYVLFILAFHATSYEYMTLTNGFSEYVVKCYYAADTAGGVFGAVLMYPLLKLNYIFAIVIVAIALFVLIGFAMFRGKGKSKTVLARSVTYDRKGKEIDPTHVQIDTELRNEDINGNELGDIKKRSRFTKGSQEYTPIEDVENFNDDEFKVDLKDNFAYNSEDVMNENDFPFEKAEDKKEDEFDFVNKDASNKNYDDTSHMTKFEKMRYDAKMAREKLYGPDEEKKTTESNQQVTDNDKFKEAIEKIRTNEDDSYISRLVNEKDDYDLYTIEGRRKIFNENLERERREREEAEKRAVEPERKDIFNDEHVEDIDKEQIVEDKVDDFDVTNCTSDEDSFDVDDFKIDDSDESNYKFDNFDAFAKDEDNKVDDEDDILFRDVKKDEIASQDEDVDEVKDEGVNYDIDDFSDSLDKDFDIKEKQDSPYDMPYYTRDKMQEDAYKKSLEEDKKDEKVEEKPETPTDDVNNDDLGPNGRRRRSDFGGTHNSSKDANESNKDNNADVDLSQFVNPFATSKEESKIEDVKPTVEEAKEEKPYVCEKIGRYIAPPVSLLNDYEFTKEDDSYIKSKCDLLVENLCNFGINVTVTSVTTGPAFSRIELAMDRGSAKSVKTFNTLASDIEMWLACNGHINILAPIPGKATVGIEIPNKTRRTVGLKEVINSPEFNNDKFHMPFALGVDIDNIAHVCDVTTAPHMLIGGATGSGKSVGISSLLVSILYKCSPDDVKLILIDPKKVELNDYEGLPHMLLRDCVYEPQQVINTLDWLIEEMERRYSALKDVHASKITEYNKKMAESGGPHMPYILLVVDEVADLMKALGKNLEDRISRLTAKSRAAGIHLVLATQRPSVKIITGDIKANLNSRIAFATAQAEDSRTILGNIGAEKLLRNGDMFYRDSSNPLATRIQGAFVSKDEVVAITDYVREHNKSSFDDSIEDYILHKQDEEEQEQQSLTTSSKPSNEKQVDEKFKDALEAAINAGHISISLLQRKLGIGYPRAGKLKDQLEEYGYIKGDKVLITHMQFIQLFGEDDQD